jgi:hypothetical protein
MPCSSRAAEYRKMVEEVIAGGLLDDDEIMELRDMIKRVERKMRADLSGKTIEAAE